VQHTVDLHRGNGRTLQRGQQDTADRITERHTEPAFQRFGDDGGDARRIGTGLDLELFRFDQVLPVALNNGTLSHVPKTFRTAANAVSSPWDKDTNSAGAYTRRRLRGRHPLCGIGVMSRIAET